MNNNFLFVLVSLMLSCSGCFGCGNEDVWHSSLKDKVCGANPQTSTKIREEFIVNVGYHRQMRFNTPDKVYLFWEKGITVVNAITKTVANVVMPQNSDRDYTIGGYALSSTNEAIMAGFYYKDSVRHNVIFYIAADLSITDITSIVPASYADNARVFKPFFLNGNLYISVITKDISTGEYSICNMLKFSLSSGITFDVEYPISIKWASDSYLSVDNFIFNYNSNTRSDPSKIIFSFDGTNYTYYGPGVAQNGPNGSYAIDSGNMFIGYYSGVVWQNEAGVWKKHAITREDEPGYSVGEIWASSKTNVFIAGRPDIFDEQNFAYHYDGACWTRWYKRDGHMNISHIWGTADGSTVLALDDEGNLYRLHVE